MTVACLTCDNSVLVQSHTAPVATYKAIGEELEADYVTEVLYIDLDTASQITWGNDDSQQKQGRFVFIQVVHATPQNSLYPHISVRVWAKQVEDDTIPARLVLQRKHILYESALGGASRVDRVVFGLQIPNPGFKMTTHKKVLLGTCTHSRCA